MTSVPFHSSLGSAARASCSALAAVYRHQMPGQPQSPRAVAAAKNADLAAEQAMSALTTGAREAAGGNAGLRTNPWQAQELTTTEDLSRAALAAAGGDEGAFAALSQRLVPGVRAVLLERVGRRQDIADDLAQRTMLGLWQALRTGRYDPARAAVSTFVYAIAHKVWLQYARADGRRLAAQQRYTLNTIVPQAGAAAEDVAEVSQAAALLQHVREALDREACEAGLTDDERWLLRNWAGGVSDRELAKRMGIAASNVNGRKQVAYRKLRTWLTTLGFGVGAGEDV